MGQRGFPPSSEAEERASYFPGVESVAKPREPGGGDAWRIEAKIQMEGVG